MPLTSTARAQDSTWTPQWILADGPGLSLRVGELADPEGLRIAARPGYEHLLEEVASLHAEAPDVFPAVEITSSDGLIDMRPVVTFARLCTQLDGAQHQIPAAACAGVWLGLIGLVRHLQTRGRSTGSISGSHVVVDAAGEIFFVAPIASSILSSQPLGVPDRWYTTAPEVRWGIEPTVASNIYALGKLMSETFPLIEPCKAMIELLRQGKRPQPCGYTNFIKWVNRRALAPEPHDRADSLAEMEDVLLKHLQADGVDPVLEAPLRSLVPFMYHHAQISRIFESRSDARRVLRADASGAWFKVGDEPPVDISRRGAVRRIFAGLLKARCLTPGQGVPRDVLQRQGWPDEVLVGNSGRARVHVAVSTLRRLGLGDDILIHQHNGYVLDPTWEFHLERPSEGQCPLGDERGPRWAPELRVADRGGRR